MDLTLMDKCLSQFDSPSSSAQPHNLQDGCISDPTPYMPYSTPFRASLPSIHVSPPALIITSTNNATINHPSTLGSPLIYSDKLEPEISFNDSLTSTTTDNHNKTDVPQNLTQPLTDENSQHDIPAPSSYCSMNTISYSTKSEAPMKQDVCLGSPCDSGLDDEPRSSVPQAFEAFISSNALTVFRQAVTPQFPTIISENDTIEDSQHDSLEKATYTPPPIDSDHLLSSSPFPSSPLMPSSQVSSYSETGLLLRSGKDSPFSSSPPIPPIFSPSSQSNRIDKIELPEDATFNGSTSDNAPPNVISPEKLISTDILEQLQKHPLVSRLKRKRIDENFDKADNEKMLENQTAPHKDCVDIRSIETKETGMDDYPKPKRLTVAAQRLQQKKLTKPFRSPLMKISKVYNAPEQPLLPVSPTETPHLSDPLKSLLVKQKDNLGEIFCPTINMDKNLLHRTHRAASQFKSPLTEGSTKKSATCVRLTPTIQSLERKLQNLKRAVNIKQKNEENTLQELIQKWTEAGREVASELWDAIKENTDTGNIGWRYNDTKGKPNKLGDSWGWDDMKLDKKEESSQPATGEPGPEVCDMQEELEENRPRQTLGTMLSQFGIAAETLGWNEEEGMFTDQPT